MDYCIHTGSTMLNLALTGQVTGGWPLGRVSNLAGNSSTGKTLLAIEAARLFLKNPPNGLIPSVYYCESEAAFDTEYARNLGAPIDNMEFVKTHTIEKFFTFMRDKVSSTDDNSALLVILDSLDALSSTAELGRDIDKGSYGAEKAKKLGELLRRLAIPLQDKNVHLLVISQLRDNITAMPFSANKQVRSGGRALDYYASHIVWLIDIGKIKSSKTKQVIGVNCKAKIRKNKISVPYKEVTFPIFPNYGIDDALSVIDFLSDVIINKENRISRFTGGYFVLNLSEDECAKISEQSSEVNKKMRREELAKYLSYNDKVFELVVARCQAAWDYLATLDIIERSKKI